METKNILHLVRETQNLLVKPLDKSDAKLLPKEEKYAALLMEQKDLRAKYLEYHVAVFDKEKTKVWGSFCLKGILRDRYQTALLEIALNQKEVGSLLLMEMLSAALSIALSEIKLHRIEILVSKDQPQLKSVLAQMAITKEAIRKQAFKAKDKWQDAEVYAITAEEYKQKNIERLMYARIDLR